MTSGFQQQQSLGGFQVPKVQPSQQNGQRYNALPPVERVPEPRTFDAPREPA